MTRQDPSVFQHRSNCRSEGELLPYTMCCSRFGCSSSHRNQELGRMKPGSKQTHTAAGIFFGNVVLHLQTANRINQSAPRQLCCKSGAEVLARQLLFHCHREFQSFHFRQVPLQLLVKSPFISDGSQQSRWISLRTFGDCCRAYFLAHESQVGALLAKRLQQGTTHWSLDEVIEGVVAPIHSGSHGWRQVLFLPVNRRCQLFQLPTFA